MCYFVLRSPCTELSPPQTVTLHLNHPFIYIILSGNASGISDGAGAIVLASEAAAAKHNLKPIARVLGYHISGAFFPHEMAVRGFGY